MRGEVVVLDVFAGLAVAFGYWHCHLRSSIAAQLVLQQSSFGRLHLAGLRLLLVVDHLEGKRGVLVLICLEVHIERAYSIGFDNVVEVGLFIEPRFVHELFLDELVVIEGISKVGLCPVAFLDGDVQEALDVDIDEDLQRLSPVQLEWELMIEGEENDLLMVDAHRDSLIFAGWVC